MQPTSSESRAAFPRHFFVLTLFLLIGAWLPRMVRAQAGPVSVPGVLASKGAAAVPGSLPLTNLTLTLARSSAQEADLQQMLIAQQTPGDAAYQHWLTPQQFAARFAPASAQREMASQWLVAQGFQVTGAAAGGMRILFSGTAQQVNHAFGMTLRQATSESASAILPDALPTVSSSLRSFVAGLVVGSKDGNDAETSLQAALDAGVESVVVLTGSGSLQASDLLKEAAATGVTLLDAGSPVPVEVTGLGAVQASAAASPGDTRPEWQFALGLPLDGLRASPDALSPDVAALATALRAYVAVHGRIGELAPSLYRLSVGHKIFTHADTSVAEGTWTAADGLGTMDTVALLKALATGTTTPTVNLSVSSTNLTHGQNLTLSFSTSGSSGVLTGTITATLRGRTSGNAVTLGPATLLNDGTVALNTSTLDGDLYDISGAYSGDSTYATGTSNTVTTTVQPETAAVTATVPSTPITVGGTIPVTVTVRIPSGVGTPSGNVSVTAYGTSVASTPFTAALGASSNATASVVVNVPATDAGTFTFQANCTATNNYTCNTPQPFSVTVGKATPTVTLTITPEAVVPNSSTQKYDIRVTATAPSGSNSSVAAPTGSVNVMDGTTTLTTIQVPQTSGAYVLSLTSSTKSLVAAYQGDGSYVAANSAAVPVNGSTGQITTTTTLQVSPNPPVAGQSATLTATVVPASTGSAAVSGTVTFFSNGVQIATGTIANGAATATVTLPAGSSVSLTATYGGDTNYSGSTSNTIGTTAGKATPVVNLTVSPEATVPNSSTQKHDISVSVTPPAGSTAAAAPTGNVNILDGTTVLATIQVPQTSGAYVLSLTTSTKSLVAAYQGDGNYVAANSAPVPVNGGTTGLIATTTTLQVSPNPPVAGQMATLTATVAPASTGSAAVSGTVTFFSNGVQIATGTIANGAATATVVLPAGSSVSLTATYGGDTNYSGSTSNTVGTTAGKATPVVNLTVVPEVTVPNSATQKYDLTVSVAPPGGSSTSTPVPTGNVNILDGTTVLATIQVPQTSGAYVLSLSSSTKSLVAAYQGDGNYVAANSAPVPVNGGSTGLIATTTTLQVTPNPPVAGQAATLTATVVPASTGSAAVSGTVTFFSNGVQIATAVIANGAATATVTLPAGSSVSLTATYGGDTNYAGSNSNTIGSTAGKATPVVNLTVVPEATIPNSATQKYDLTVSVTPPAGSSTSAPIPTGTVNILDGATVLATIQVPQTSGAYVLSLTSSTRSLVAAYQGDGNYVAANSAPVSINGSTSLIATTTTLQVSPNPPLAGQPVTLTAVVTPASSGPALTGTVSFLSNGVVIATAALSGSTATATVTLPAGNAIALTATYSGDVNYAGSNASGVGMNTGKAAAAITLTSNVSAVNAGGSILLIARVTPVSTLITTAPTGTVTFFDNTSGVPNAIGTAAVTPGGIATGIATLNVASFSGGTHLITAVYNGDASFLPVASMAVSVSVGDFSLTFSPGSLLLSPGASGTAKATITLLGSYSGQIIVSCVPPAAVHITCSLNAPVVAGNGTTTLTINTSVATASLRPAPAMPGKTAAGGIAAALALMGLVLPRRRRQLGALLLLLVCVTVMSGGCSLSIVDSTNNSNNTGGGTGVGSGGTTTPGTATPYGTFLLNITATAADNSLRHTYTFPVTVQ